MSEYAIHVDDWRSPRWNMTGRDLLYSRMEEKGTPQHRAALKRAKECGCKLEDVIDEFADENVPMMNYAYPLEFEPSEEKIIEICERTNCTVVEDNDTGEFFLALTGGGMDLSQDVALAYIIAQKWLPISLLQNISTQYGLSKSGKDFEQIRGIIIEQANMEGARLLALAKAWKEIKTRGR